MPEDNIDEAMLDIGEILVCRALLNAHEKAREVMRRRGVPESKIPQNEEGCRNCSP